MIRRLVSIAHEFGLGSLAREPGLLDAFCSSNEKNIAFNLMNLTSNEQFNPACLRMSKISARVGSSIA
jgi:hypothetical protein